MVKTFVTFFAIACLTFFDVAKRRNKIDCSNVVPTELAIKAYSAEPLSAKYNKNDSLFIPAVDTNMKDTQISLVLNSQQRLLTIK